MYNKLANGMCQKFIQQRINEKDLASISLIIVQNVRARLTAVPILYLIIMKVCIKHKSNQKWGFSVLIQLKQDYLIIMAHSPDSFGKKG